MIYSTEDYGPDKGGDKMDHGAAAYPFPGSVVDLSDPMALQQYLAKFNKVLADVENALLHDKLLPGMAGYGDMQSGQTGYAVPSPGPDMAKGMTIELQRK